jgi:hypothetical protein
MSIIRQTSADVSSFKCVVRCQLWGSEACLRCPLPDARGRLRCPQCGSPLCFLQIIEDWARWGCSNLTGCGQTFSLPVRDPEAAAAADAELADLKRAKAKERKRLQRQRKRTDLHLAGRPG